VTDQPTRETIANDLVDYLRENPGVCASVSVGMSDHPWIRYRDGEWQAASYADIDRIDSRVVDEERVVSLIEANPTNLIPCHEAYRWKPADQTVWEDAAEQDAFSDRDRCVWCGFSDRTRNLSLYQTVDDGECLLCDDCHEAWDKDDEIVQEVPEE